MKCPKCNGTDISAQKAGFGLGKAVTGAALTGGVGLLAGFAGSNKVNLHCLNCGHKWNPVKQAKKEKQTRDALKWKRSEERWAARKTAEKLGK